MSEQELVRALRDLIAKDLPDSIDSRQLAREVSRRDRRRVRLLAGLCLLFWLLAAAGLVLLVVGLDRFVIHVRISDIQPMHRGNTGPNAPFSPDPMGQMYDGTNLLHHSIPIIGASVVALLLAALCTVLLIATSRRATLHQIHISLMELSEQLKQLRTSESVRKPDTV